MKTRSSRSAPETCPACGADVPAKALACPACGADHETGWNEEAAVYDGLDLPEDGAFDYDAYIRREFPDAKAKGRGRAQAWLWLLLAAGAVAAGVVVWRLIGA